MDGIRTAKTEPQAVAMGQVLLAIEVDLSLYSLQAVFRACYKFTNHCYLFLSHTEDPSWLAVTLLAKDGKQNSHNLAGELYNEFLDQQIREALSFEMGPIRELIVAQAFAEGNLLDSMRDEGNYQEDPLGIVER
jgi:His-Xaa-Ser system protein HxsD